MNLTPLIMLWLFGQSSKKTAPPWPTPLHPPPPLPPVHPAMAHTATPAPAPKAAPSSAPSSSTPALTPQQSAKELQAYLAKGGKDKATIARYQTGMGGVTADGIAGPKTKARMTMLGAPPVPAALNKLKGKVHIPFVP